MRRECVVVDYEVTHEKGTMAVVFYCVATDCT